MADVYVLAKLTYEQVECLDKNKLVVILPMGPLEAHGPHLPLGVDFCGAVILTELAAEKVLIQLLPRFYHMPFLMLPCLLPVQFPFPRKL